LSRSFSLDLLFQHAPTVLEPLNISEAIPESDLRIALDVSDDDGLGNVICSLAVMDNNGTRLMQSSQAVGEDHQFSTTVRWMYPLPRALANQTLAVNVTCVDELMQTVTDSSQVMVGPAEPCMSCNTTTTPEAASTDDASSGIGMQAAFALGVVVLVATVTLIGAGLARRRQRRQEKDPVSWGTPAGFDLDDLFDATEVRQVAAVSNQDSSPAQPEVIPDGWTGAQFVAWLDGPLPEGWTAEQWTGYIETHRNDVQRWLSEHES